MKKALVITIFTIFTMVNTALAAWSYPGCPDISDNDFQQVVLVGKSPLHSPRVVDATLNEPIEFDFVEDGQGNVDIYFTERHGKLKFYDASENTVTTIGQLNVDSQQDCGFNGIVLDPNFKETRWLYLFYTPDVATSEEERYRLSRVTLDADNEMDLTTEKVIFEHPVRYPTPWHTGGSMHFDIYGDLWIACGKNANDDPGSTNESDGAMWRSCEFSSSNTHSVRGAVIRIHPIPFPDSETPQWGRGSTYEIPKGNFGDYFALKYEKEGNSARAAEFRDTSRVLPELYAHGARNPWTLNVEPVKRWVVWGENGINRGYNHEEHNFTRVPGFFGFPYFAGNPDEPNPSLATTCSDGGITCPQGYNISAKMNVPREMDPETPYNISKWNTGLEDLTPAIPSASTYGQSSAMTGPIYRYDGDLQSDVKLPPHFDGVWFITDFNNHTTSGRMTWLASRIRATVVDDEDPIIVKNEEVFANMNFYRPIDLETGPDGALYIINYAGWFNSNENTNIARIEYVGDCRPEEPKLEEKANPDVYYPTAGYGCTCPGDANYNAGAFALDLAACADTRGTNCALSVDNRFTGQGSGIYISEAAIEIKGQGRHSVIIRDVSGRQVLAWENNRPATYGYDALTRPGIYFVTVVTGREQASGKVCIME
jgi:cytochrome c